MGQLTVGQAADHTGLTPKAIRLYERRGLLTTAERTDGGYRLFDDHDLAVLGFIRQARALGLGLSEIKTVLDLQRGGQQPCDHVTAMLDTHLADIDRKLADLQQLRDTLAGARQTAERTRRGGEAGAVCRIIESGTRSSRPDSG